MKNIRLMFMLSAALIVSGCAEMITSTVAGQSGLRSAMAWKEFDLVPGKDDERITALKSMQHKLTVGCNTIKDGSNSSTLESIVSKIRWFFKALPTQQDCERTIQEVKEEYTTFSRKDREQASH
jgi:hypothetical protein